MLMDTKIQMSYDDIVRLVNDMKTNNQDRIQDRKLAGLLEHKDLIEKYLDIIQNNTNSPLDILTQSSTDRYVIYKLCEILNIRCQRIEKHETRIFGCDQFSGPKTTKYGCGCGNVPKRLRKYESGLDYDDH